MIREELSKLVSGAGFIITGDLNASPGSPAIKMMLRDTLIKNSFLISEIKPSGPFDTFNGRSEEQGRGRVDYIIVRNGIAVKSFRTYNVIRDCIYISDHWPMTAKICIAAR